MGRKVLIDIDLTKWRSCLVSCLFYVLFILIIGVMVQVGDTYGMPGDGLKILAGVCILAAAWVVANQLNNDFN